MSFLVVNKHDYRTCNAHNLQSLRAMNDIVNHATGHNITGHDRYDNRLKHTYFTFCKPSE